MTLSTKNIFILFAVSIVLHLVIAYLLADPGAPAVDNPSEIDSLKRQLSNRNIRHATARAEYDSSRAAWQGRDSVQRAEIARLQQKVLNKPDLARATAADLDNITAQWPGKSDTLYSLPIDRMRAVTSDALVKPHLQRLNFAQERRIQDLQAELLRTQNMLSETQEWGEDQKRVNEAIQAAQYSRIDGLERQVRKERKGKTLWQIIAGAVAVIAVVK